jgi:acetyl esterase/lipase
MIAFFGWVLLAVGAVGLGWLLLAVGATSLLLSFNALHPRYAHAGVATASFFSGWLRSELAAHVFIFETLLLAYLLWSGGLLTWPGRIGALLLFASLALLLMSVQRSRASGAAINEAVANFMQAEAPSQVRWRQLVLPLPLRGREVERLRNRVYHDDPRLRLDIYRRRGADHGPNALRPAVIYVHGGAWMIGNKAQQGLPLLHHFAALGWVCFSIEYRLSPKATFPDHVVDVKRAIAWVRAHAHEHGVDPGFLVVGGNSAGGHLASLAALTAGDRAFQPGFEDADASVAACLSFYGVYDFSNRHGHWPNAGMQAVLQRYVMKARLAEAPDRFEAASPIARVGPHAPPFLVVHGAADSIVPVAEARTFVDALRRTTKTACAYIEVPGAQHAFEVFPSVRTQHLLHGVERFARHLHREHLAAYGR